MSFLTLSFSGSGSRGEAVIPVSPTVTNSSWASVLVLAEEAAEPSLGRMMEEFRGVRGSTSLFELSE